MTHLGEFDGKHELRMAADEHREAVSTRPPVLLALADYYGTLAAVRSLGRAGIPVRLAEWRLFVAARWSRHVSQVMGCPDIDADPGRFIDWLLRLGARQPGQVLQATSDELAWLFALRREELARHFRLDVPPIGTMYTLLNKWRLRNACAAVGLGAPDTWLPRDEGAVTRLAREVQFPLIVKPQTQVLLSPHRKGQVVRDAKSLPGLYREFRASVRHAPSLLQFDPGVDWPMVQVFHDGAANDIYNLCGFVGDAEDAFVVRASRKVLQRPRFAGVGLCFEEDEVALEVAEKLHALCRRVGYHGVFEAEFLRMGGRHLLIDFNPRFYGQMGFDVGRGMNLPLLTYLAAIGDRPALRRSLEEARQAPPHVGRTFCHAFQLKLFLVVLRLVGRLREGDARRWRAWLADHRASATDAVWSRDDWVPALVDMAWSLYQHARHPRSTLRSTLESG